MTFDQKKPPIKEPKEDFKESKSEPRRDSFRKPLVKEPLKVSMAEFFPKKNPSLK